MSVPSAVASERGDRGDLERQRHGVDEPGDGVPVLPVVEREALPRVVEAARRVVERERDHDRDRQEQVREGEHRVDGQDVLADEREHAPARPDPDGFGGDRGHPVSFSVPSARE